MTRLIAYFEGYDGADALLDSAGSITHAVPCLFHLGYGDKTNSTAPRAIYNQPVINPLPPFFSKVVPALKERGVVVMGSLGGSGVQDYEHLFGDYDVFYPILVDMIRSCGLQGLDMDIEESSITTENVQRLVDDLRTDFPGEFYLSSAPVAWALVDQQRSMTPSVDYKKLLPRFDWYNLQFYNGWGTLGPLVSLGGPDYQAVAEACGSENVSKLVGGIPTNSSLAEYVTIVENLNSQYPDFGGIDGWTFQTAVNEQGNPDPVAWFGAIREALRPSQHVIA